MTAPPKTLHPALRLAASLELTIAALGALMVLVVACTLAQVHLGAFGAVKAYIRSVAVYWSPAGASWRVPIFPGGALVGLVLLANLLAAHWLRFERSWRKAGMWTAHLGLILLFAGEFVTAAFQTDSRLAVEEGQTRNYSEDVRRSELVLIDAADPDALHAVPEELLRRPGDVADPRLPVTLRVTAFEASGRDDGDGRAAVRVEALGGGKSLGAWRLVAGEEESPAFVLAGRSYRLALRPARRYFRYALTLVKFRRDVHPGTDIPKSFSSVVRLSDPAKGQERDVLISMNNPLRYEGKTFYQSGFGRGDTLSIFQVVENPGRRLPYLSCALVAAGLLMHFLSRLRAGARGA